MSTTTKRADLHYISPVPSDQHALVLPSHVCLVERAQSAVIALDARLCDDVRQPLMSETLPILAKHNVSVR